MANELNIQLDPGLTITAQIVQNATQVGSNVALTESGSLSGFYSGDMPGATAAGAYQVRFLSGADVVGSGQIAWDGSSEITLGLLSTTAELEARTLPVENYFDSETDLVAIDAIAPAVIAQIQSGLATAAAVGAIPTDPLLASDSRLDNLDAAISSRSSHGAPDLTNLDAAVSSRLADAVYTAPNNTGISTLVARLSADRATYLDKLNVPGSLANSSSASAYQANLAPIIDQLNAIQGSGFDTAVHGLVSIRTRGDEAWVTAMGGGSATEANQTSILNALSQIQGSGFNSAGHSLKAIVDHGDGNWAPSIGSGSATEAKQDEILNAILPSEVITPTRYQKIRFGDNAVLADYSVTNDGNGNITLTRTS